MEWYAEQIKTTRDVTGWETIYELFVDGDFDKAKLRMTARVTIGGDHDENTWQPFDVKIQDLSIDGKKIDDDMILDCALDEVFSMEYNDIDLNIMDKNKAEKILSEIAKRIIVAYKEDE
jgi:hypothetical protein